MRFLLDTNILIYALQRRAGEAFHNFLFHLAQRGAVLISAISRFELLAGSTEDHRKKNVEFLDSFPLLNIDKKLADRAGLLFASFRKKGLTVDNEDLLLAATALEEKLCIVTTNAKHFPDFMIFESHAIDFTARKGQIETKKVFLMMEGQ